MSEKSWREDDAALIAEDHRDVGQYDDEILSWMYRVAIKINIKHTPEHCAIGNLNEEQVENGLPESLYTLVSLLFSGRVLENPSIKSRNKEEKQTS